MPEDPAAALGLVTLQMMPNGEIKIQTSEDQSPTLTETIIASAHLKVQRRLLVGQVIGLIKDALHPRIIGGGSL